jgi:predicted Zn-dependent peptidase
METTRSTQLKNGLKVVYARLPGNVTTVAVFVRAGSEYETRTQSGISHFLEHACFRGTKQYKTHEAISHAFESLGTSANAFTSEEYTCYYARVANHDIKKAADTLFDVCFNPALRGNEIKRERGVIAEEIDMNDDDRQTKAWDLFRALLYPSQPAGMNILGTKKSIRSFTRKDLLAYHRAQYAPNRTVIVVAGNVPFSAVKRSITSSLSRLPKGTDEEKPATRDTQTAFRELIAREGSNQVNFILGFRAFPASDPRRYQLEVLQAIMGGMESSRLWQKIYSKWGAAYNINMMNVLGSDHGHVAISGAVESAKLPRVLSAIRDECHDVLLHGVTARELEMAKKHLVAAKRISNETSDDWARSLGEQEILRGTHGTLTDDIRGYQKVTRGNISVLARHLFRNDRMNLALVGPVRTRTFRNIVRL